jgi:flavin reductase (DIM6/NTAB) family NADH-FMN oxidoreductase RutF
MRRMAKSAVIVTSKDEEDILNPAKGLTVSSFTTVSFDPEVVVSLNLRVPSSTHDAIEVSNFFLVHVLKANKQAIDMASRFSSGQVSASSTFKLQSALALQFAAEHNKQKAQPLPPFLGGFPGPLDAVAACVICQYRIGDHVVVFGVVQDIVKFEEELEENSSYLAYSNRSFGRVKPFIVPVSSIIPVYERMAEETFPTRNEEDPPTSNAMKLEIHESATRPFLYSAREAQEMHKLRLSGVESSKQKEHTAEDDGNEKDKNPSLGDIDLIGMIDQIFKPRSK